MQDSLSQALVGAADRMEAEMSLSSALPVISDMADIHHGRSVLEECLEKIAMADGGVMDVLEAEDTYRDWRADHADVFKGQAQTGTALVDEMRVSLEMLNSPSMESLLIQQLKRTFNSMSLSLKTFGKDLVDIRSKLNGSKAAIQSDPVLIDSPAAYGFLTRSNKPVKLVGSIDQDLEFIKAATTHYQTLFDISTDLSQRFRAACNTDDDDSIRSAVDYFDSHLIDRSVFEDLTKFKLLGNRTVFLDKRGFPQFQKDGNPWKVGKDVKDMVAKKQLHGFCVGGALVNMKGITGMNEVAAKRQINAQIKSTGGEVSVESFMSVVDKAITLNSQTVKFAQMAATMYEKVQRLTSDMDDAYRFVNNEKDRTDNIIRLKSLRALYRSARRSVSQYMFLGKSVATMMEDHASYVYRNVTLISNEVLKKSVKEKQS